MITTILDKANFRTGSVSEGASPYKHTFGGPPRHEGVQLAGLGRPAHLLYCFDLEDPAVGLTLPGVRWLPIYYAFWSQGGAFGIAYRVLSDDRVELLNKPFRARVGRATRDFYEHFPAQFRKRKIT